MSHGFKEQSKAYAIKGNSPAPYGKAAAQTFSSIRSRRRLHGAKRRRSGSGAFLTTSLNLPGGFFCTPLLVLAENSLRMRAAGALHHVPARLCRKASPRPDRKGKPKFLCCFLFQPQRTHSFPRMMNYSHIVVGMSTVCARRGLFSAEAVVAAQAENRKMKVINRPASASKKAEARKSPCTPWVAG